MATQMIMVQFYFSIFQVCSFMCGKIVIKTEFKIHVWCVHRKRQTAVSSLWLEVRGFVTFSFLDRSRLSPEKKINMSAAILNHTKDGGPSFQSQNVAKRLVF